MNQILNVENINKTLSKKHILKNVSFSLNEGQILGFIGPNGAGKTTTIKLILGLQKIDSGKITINGYDVKKDFEKAIERVGAIVENPDSYMYLTGYQNIKLISNLYKNIDEKRIQEVINITGLQNRINDKVSKYSLGMRQRLGIAISILNKPNLLILDEPTNGLDPEGIKELRDLLKKLAKEEKMGILISSHNLAELESFCNNVCIIKNGEIISQNTISEIKKETTPSYLIELNKTDNIGKIIDTKYEILDSNNIKVTCSHKELSNILKKLLEKDYEIYEAKKLVMTLEEAFIKKTGGNIID